MIKCVFVQYVLSNLSELTSFSFQSIEKSTNGSSPIEPKHDEKVNGTTFDGSVRSKRKGD